MRSAVAREPGLYKTGYDGPASPSGPLTPHEADRMAESKDGLVRRLHDAMLVLSVLEGEGHGGASSWPSYVHDFNDLVGRDADPPRPKRFRPTPSQLDGFLAALQLLDGLRSVYLKVIFLRAMGEFHGGWSWEEIGERYGRTGEWARRSYEAVVIQAARRGGLLPPAPEEYAILVVSVRVGGPRTYLTVAGDPRQQLYDLKSKCPVDLEDAFALWTPGKAVAQALAKKARQHLLGREIHGSWHWASPDDMADLLIGAARAMNSPWRMEALDLPRPRNRAKWSAGQVGGEE